MRLTLQGLALVAALGFSLGGCTINVVDQGGSSSSGATAGSGGNTTSSSASTGQGGGGGAGGMGAGGSSGTGAGAPCGGFAGTQCGPTEYCDFPDDICGGADGVGVCTIRPTACPDFYSPTCACDGNVYGNACDAASAGFDVSNLGSCQAPTKDMFQCGHGFCNKLTEYCVRTTADVPNTPDAYTCAPLPMACGVMPSCDCLMGTCGAPTPPNCSATPQGGLMVTCPGG